MMSHRKTWLVFMLLALGAAALDLITKQWLFSVLGMPGRHPGIVVVPGILSLETNLNEGALFGIGQGFGMVFAAISVVAIGGIVAMVSRPATRGDPRLLGALGLITGGIIGNLYDRLGLAGLSWEDPASRAGSPVIAVRDWIHFRLDGLIDWPVFNLADAWLVIGATGLIAISLRPDRGSRLDTKTDEKRAAGPGDARSVPEATRASAATAGGRQ